MKSKVSQSNSPWWIEANTSYSFTVVQVPIYWCAPGPPAHPIHTNNMGQPILGSSPRIGTSTNMRNKYSTLFRKKRRNQEQSCTGSGQSSTGFKVWFYNDSDCRQNRILYLFLSDLSALYQRPKAWMKNGMRPLKSQRPGPKQEAIKTLNIQLLIWCLHTTKAPFPPVPSRRRPSYHRRWTNQNSLRENSRLW